MNNSDLFKSLVKSYKAGNFEETVNKLLNESADNKVYAAKTISSLCGVEVDHNSSSFAEDLKFALENYNANCNIVTRIKDCHMNCTIINEKTKCQAQCPFDAILVNATGSSTYIDNTKCTHCGFCVEACPNNNYLDKVEFLPLIKELI